MADNKTRYNLSYSQDNPNVNKLIEGIFGAITKDDIRVGYIDPELGYVINVTICEANDYAKKNPGTRFIFRNGNGYLKYININEVNKLTPSDIISSSICPGIQTAYNCNQPPIVQILGGGGIGAVAKANIIDGSVMSIEVIRGGYGYQYPPEVRIIDPCGIGAGAVATAVLGEVSETEEMYENELEEYEICEPNDVGYGKVYGPNGEDLGNWDPTLYTNTDSNSIAKEVKRYQEEINKYKNPFWTTNKFQPSSITAPDKHIYRQTYKMPSPDDKTINWNDWTDFIKTYAVSPVPISNVPGSDNAGKLFIMQWDVYFPYDGEYIFRGLCDNAAKFYIDNTFIADLSIFNQPVSSLQKTIKKGIHKIRIDLINYPFYETKVIQQTQKLKKNQEQPAGGNFIKEGSEYYLLVSGNDVIELDFLFDWYYGGGVNKWGLAASKITIPTETGGPIIFEKPPGPSRSLDAGSIKKTGTFKANKKYGPIIIEGRDRRSLDPEIVDTESNPDQKRQKINLFDGEGYDVNSSLTLIPPPRQLSPPKTLAVSLPQTSTSIPSTISQGIQTRKIFNTVDYINKANRQLWRINPNASPGSGFINQYGILPFDPNSADAQKDSFAGIHTIIWNNIDFPVDGNYIVHVAVDDNVTLYIGDTVIKKQGFYTGTSTGRPDLDQQYVFKKGTYTIKAELEQSNVGPLSKGNPMALAVDINIDYTTQEVISAKSWKENPMGVALTIDAPEPPIPQEKLPVQEGRCPPNPFWTTHFPGSSEKWYPVLYPKGKVWSDFMNRYALSPTKPLDTPGSDKSGITYKNSWKVKIPYKGYYGVKGCVDDTGSISIDGNKVSALDRFDNNKPKLNKVYLTEGDHTIEVEVYNGPMGTINIVDQKIFSTKDWIVPSSAPKTVDVDFDISISGLYANSFKIEELEIDVSKEYGAGKEIKQKIKKTLEYGRTYAVKLSSVQGRIQQRIFTENFLQVEDSSNPDNPYHDIECITSVGKFFGSQGDTCKFVVQYKASAATSGVSKSGVTYNGPTPIANYKADFISPFFEDVITKPNEEIQGKTWNFSWSNVDFPEDGEYSLIAEADDNLIVRVDGVEVGKAKVFGGRRTTNFNASKGKRTVELELSNIRIANTGFQENPVVGFAEIYKKVEVTNFNQKSWLDNPMGVSAVLIPPPCPRKISGKGIVNKIIVIDPGNGYPGIDTTAGPGIGTTAGPGIGTTAGPGISTTSYEIIGIAGTEPGIRYSCGVDKIKTIPDLGCKFNYTCDSFGRILSVAVEGKCSGFTEYPKIYMETKTGINFSAIPILSPTEPVGITTQNLIQVTDLAGLKQTGYVNGKPYYGAVYYENGLRYAGYYQTIGTPVRVYDTLQESITGEVTTPPSAIERFGTDVNSNDPRLNIPGTPENTIGP